MCVINKTPIKLSRHLTMHFLCALFLTKKLTEPVPTGSVWLLVPPAQSNLINFSCSSRNTLLLHIFLNMNKSSSSDSNQKQNKKGQAFLLLKQEPSRCGLSRVWGIHKEVATPYAWHCVVHGAEAVSLIWYGHCLSLTLVNTGNDSAEETWLLELCCCLHADPCPHWEELLRDFMPNFLSFLQIYSCCSPPFHWMKQQRWSAESHHIVIMRLYYKIIES